MRKFTRAGALDRYLNKVRSRGGKIGFVPTMGALHEGHLALARRAREENDIAVCSIFVNPTQFNDPDDLARYPRMPQRDAELLAGKGVDALFLPSEAEVYPLGIDWTLSLDLGALDQVLEGAFRPGHFAGVAMVMKRLLDILAPDRLYMGQKDYQQTLVVRRLIEQLRIPTALIVCPTVREADGLAMSSRNQRLSPEYRQLAPALYQALLSARRAAAHWPAPALEERGASELARAGLRPEYFAVVEGGTLAPVRSLDEVDAAVACAAAWAGDIRLIDNIVIKENGRISST
jgi:pantoate--beta-alanine ligase